MTVALLGVASITGCHSSNTLPPLAEEPGGPQIPGKFVWHSNPMNRYGYGFYGHP
jgi:hypothetical protein